MIRRIAGIWLALAMVMTTAYACGGDDDDSSEEGGSGGSGGEGGEGGEGGDGEEPEDAGTPDADDVETDAEVPEEDAALPPLFVDTCGDGEVQGFEQCDDGNSDNSDGCTTLCEFTCIDNIQCDDGNACNGTETCEDNMCLLADDLEDGTPCGENRSCWQGICDYDVCGDETVQGDEECDDGDTDDTNGCTMECKWTCVPGDSDRDCGGFDECAGELTCNEETHACDGEPLGDEADCDFDGADGWCINGRCVPKFCGDGDLDPGEDCDEGEDNGRRASGCSRECETLDCGNGTIEGDEECDDGNFTRLDGCDPECRVELVHRWSRIDLVSDYVPDFCAYQTNRFAQAFGNMSDLAGLMPTGGIAEMAGIDFDPLAFVNQRLGRSITSGENNSLMQILDSSDTSMRTVDREIQIAIYDGVPAKNWEPGPPVDFPFYIGSDAVDENRVPLSIGAAMQSGGGRVVSTEAGHFIGEGPLGDFEMFDAKARVVFDTSDDGINGLTWPQHNPLDPFATAEWVKIPARSGYSEDGPAGIICGAMTEDTIDQEPVSQEITMACCKEDGAPYVLCEGDEVTADCDSWLDVLKSGCNSCLIMELVSGLLGGGTDPASLIDRMTSGESTCSPGCEGFPLVAATLPDVDTDDDGENDAYTTVLAFQGTRVGIRGVTESD